MLLAAAGGTGAYAQIGLDPAKALTQYHLDAWSTDDGLPQNSINALIQTRNGYLWLGTQEGLVRFDGISFKGYDKSNSALSVNYVGPLAEDRHGALWIGTRGGGLSRFQDGTFTTFTTDDGLPSNEISVLMADRAGTLWVGSYEEGLARLPGGQIAALAPLPGLPSKKISALHEDRQGALWIGTRDGGLTRLHEGRLTTFTTAEGLASNDVTALHDDRHGALWIGTRDGGLSRFKDGRFTTFDTDDGLPVNGVYALFEDAAGSLWIGTFQGGLCRLQAARLACFSTTEGLTHNTVKTLFSDREGSLWIGTDGGGLNRLRDGKFTTYSTQEGLVNNFVFTVYEDDQGGLWVGTEGGGASRYRDGRFTTFTAKDGLASDFVRSIYGTRDGSLWMGTGEGLSRLKNGRFTTFTTQDGLADNAVWALYADAQDNLWIATEHGLARYRDGRFTTFTTQDGLSSNIITAIAEGADGTLWVGTYNGGLNRFKDGRAVATYSTEDGLEADFVLSIYVDAEDTVWFSTREGGLSRLRDGRLTTFTTKDGLFNDTILQILEDDRGNLWMSSSRGLFVLNKQDLHRFADGQLEALTPTVYDQTDGLKTQEFSGGTQPAGWRGKNGWLWFPSVGAGIAGIDPAQIARNELPPLVALEEATANDRAIPLQGTATLSPGLDKFEFHYAGLSLLAPEKVRYRYMLEGVDEDWVEAGTRREAFYTNLAPGTYTFRVKARNNDGVWSTEAASVSFYLQPFFHQTPLFFVLCALGLILLAFVAYRLRVGHLKRRERELVQLVEERTVDLRQEKERTEEALLETEEARREAERQKEIVEEAKAVIEEQAEKLQEMDRIKTRFFNNISHEFRTPLTLNIGPLENALMGVYGPVSDEMRKRLEIMLRNSRLLLRLINQLLDVSKLESGKMELKVRHGNLVELLEGVVLSFTAFAEKKHLALTFQAEQESFSLNFDPGHLEKVFFNLLSNAVKFTPEQGRITVSICHGAPNTQGVEGETVEIRFQDSGPGIPEKDLPYIFDRFHQVDGTISKVQEGTGIGLSLVKELVELHGGTIRVESQVGRGTTFLVTLPKDTRHLEGFLTEGDGALEQHEPISRGAMVEMAVFDDDDEAAPGVNGNAALPPEAPTVLVVDDNPEIRDYVAGCMRGTYHVVKAFDGKNALEKARQIRPDLIISDVMMPNMNGYELCQAVKADPALGHTPVILLTSRASLDEKIQGLEAGSDDYLTKPFSAKELLVRARNLLYLGMQQKALQALNKELKQTNEELREVSQMKSQLLRIAAHDLKNPLNGIREFAKILKEEIDTDAPSLELLDLIHTSSDQMLNMVGKLLDSEALESGKLVFEKEPVSVNDIAETVVRRNRKQAERKGETLHLRLDEGDPCLVEASREWLRDAMDNLVSNAIKYSPLNKNIWVMVRRNGPVVHFSVRDEGPGLTEDDKKKLFGKFQRLSALPTSDESSTGLGLSIVKQIVDMHGGRVWAESQVGRGSTFTIELASASVGEPVDG